MTLDSFFVKLNQNLEMAKKSLKMQLQDKIKLISENIESYSSLQIRDELDRLVDDFILEFSSVYEEFVSYLEEELPVVSETPKPPKKKKKITRKEPNYDEFVKPTYVHRAFNDFGLRVSKDARPMIMDFLNEKIKKDIEKIKEQIPTYQKGEKEGEKKRITIKPEDLSKEELLAINELTFEKELEQIPLDLNGKDYRLFILLRHLD